MNLSFKHQYQCYNHLMLGCYCFLTLVQIGIDVVCHGDIVHFDMIDYSQKQKKKKKRQ